MTWARVPGLWFSSKGMHKKSKHCLTAKNPSVPRTDRAREQHTSNVVPCWNWTFRQIRFVGLRNFSVWYPKLVLRHVNFLGFPSSKYLALVIKAPFKQCAWIFVFIIVDVIPGVQHSLPCINCVNTKKANTQRKLKTEIELLSTCDKLACHEIDTCSFYSRKRAMALSKHARATTTIDFLFIASQNSLLALVTHVVRPLLKTLNNQFDQRLISGNQTRWISTIITIAIELIKSQSSRNKTT